MLPADGGTVYIDWVLMLALFQLGFEVYDWLVKFCGAQDLEDYAQMKVLANPEVPYRWRVRMSELAHSHIESSFVDVEPEARKRDWMKQLSKGGPVARAMTSKIEGNAKDRRKDIIHDFQLEVPVPKVWV